MKPKKKKKDVSFISKSLTFPLFHDQKQTPYYECDNGIIFSSNNSDTRYISIHYQSFSFNIIIIQLFSLKKYILLSIQNDFPKSKKFKTEEIKKAGHYKGMPNNELVKQILFEQGGEYKPYHRQTQTSDV